MSILTAQTIKTLKYWHKINEMKDNPLIMDMVETLEHKQQQINNLKKELERCKNNGSKI